MFMVYNVKLYVCELWVNKFETAKDIQIQNSIHITLFPMLPVVYWTYLTKVFELFTHLLICVQTVYTWFVSTFILCSEHYIVVTRLHHKSRHSISSYKKTYRYSNLHAYIVNMVMVINYVALCLCSLCITRPS